MSRPDRLNIIIARDLRAVLVTNDRLQRQCAAEQGVNVIWGLSMVVELVRVRELTRDAAISVLGAIQNQNPKYVTEDIVNGFIERIKGIRSRKAKPTPTRGAKTSPPRGKR